MSIIAENIAKVLKKIEKAAQAQQRNPDEITLLAVSKTRTATEIRQAYSQGLQAFGENYLQEALEKMPDLQDLDITWHFIGPIQSNKTSRIAEHFSWAHSVDRLKIAQRLSEARPANLPPLHVCIQVNIDEETSKSGCSLSEAKSLACAVSQLPNLQLRGFMVIPAPQKDMQTQRAIFAQLRRLLDACREDGLKLDTLSMGMSDDLEAAILEGSTMVRVGSALFGARPT